MSVTGLLIATSFSESIHNRPWLLSQALAGSELSAAVAPVAAIDFRMEDTTARLADGKSDSQPGFKSRNSFDS
jgi:hypothetical protein